MIDTSLPAYQPSSFPDYSEGMSAYLVREFRRLATAVNELSLRVPHAWDVAPPSPRPGMVVWAKAPWNPGAGDGLYAYNPATSAWVKAT